MQKQQQFILIIANKLTTAFKAFIVIGFCGLSMSLFAQSEASETALEIDAEKVTKDIEISVDAIKLAKILANTLTYQADFEQSVYRDTSAEAEITIGQFLIQRPNHFKWETIRPYQQSIIADGKYLWNFDPELEQATIRDQQSVLSDSPLLLLTSSADSLVKAFDVSEVNNSQAKIAGEENQYLFALKPKENGLFESVHILIEQNKIKELFLVDTLGGRTSVKFSNIKLNQKIEIQEFIFTPPEGVDVIDSRENIAE